VTIEEVESDDKATVCAYTDGSKQDEGVGSGVAIFKGCDLVAKVQLKLDKRCSNSQDEHTQSIRDNRIDEQLWHQPTHGDHIYGQPCFTKLTPQP
jgi:hypothetical protein